METPRNKQTKNLEKTIVGWRTIQDLGNDIKGMQTIIVEEEMDIELLEAYQSQVRANKALRTAITYQVSEMGYN